MTERPLIERLESLKQDIDYSWGSLKPKAVAIDAAIAKIGRLANSLKIADAAVIAALSGIEQLLHAKRTQSMLWKRDFESQLQISVELEIELRSQLQATQGESAVFEAVANELKQQLAAKDAELQGANNKVQVTANLNELLRGDLQEARRQLAELQPEKFIEGTRRQILKWLQIGNQEESILGACNNRMQEVITLRGNEEMLEQQNAHLASQLREAREAWKLMLRYHAVEGRLLGDESDLVGLAHDGSQWGPVANPKYEMFELAEAFEKWLHEQAKAALAKMEEKA